MEPEDLVRDFMSVSNIKIGSIRTDNVFTASTAFKTFCKQSNITYEQSAAYTHTMQAHVEGAVRICKDHFCCLLKSSNAPARFWQFALLHFCRTYNYWPGVNSQPPWEAMQQSNFSFNIDSYLHPWGCYVVGKLPKEHPPVSVNTTHADRGIKG
eukprot:3431949-Rhodomonas_salina.1